MKEPKTLIKTIEDAEKAAEKLMANPNEINAALERLKTNVKHNPKLPDADIKLEMLAQFSEIMEPSIAKQCKELYGFIVEIFGLQGVTKL